MDSEAAAARALAFFNIFWHLSAKWPAPLQNMQRLLSRHCLCSSVVSLPSFLSLLVRSSLEEPDVVGLLASLEQLDEALLPVLDFS